MTKPSSAGNPIGWVRPVLVGPDPPWRAACKASPNFVYAVYVIFNNAYALFEAKMPRPSFTR